MSDVHVCADGLPREAIVRCRVCDWVAPRALPTVPSRDELRTSTKAALAHAYGVSPALVSHWRKQAGIVGERVPGVVHDLRRRVAELEAEVERLCGALREARGLNTQPLRGSPSDQLLDEARRLGVRGLARAVGVGEAEVSRVLSGKVGIRSARLARWLAAARAEPTPIRRSSRRGALRAPAPRVAE